MNRLVCMCVLVALFIGCCPGQCPALPLDGVLVQERVVDLPQDQNKWYLSVVGVKDSVEHVNLIDEFNNNENLKGFKKQVHFREVANDTVIYRDRYAPNVKGLPTVRLQKANGAVVYEVHGEYIPLSAEGLYGALADATMRAQGVEILFPWNRQQRGCPRPICPKPKPEPPPGPAPDPKPQPIDNSGPPVVDNTRGGVSTGWIIFWCFLSSAIGAGVGFVTWWKQEYSER